jgi:hypothetical protein
MRLDLRKLDERIKRLQEIRRIASDPEAATILLECMTNEDERSDRPPAAKDEAVGAHTQSDDASDLVTDVMKGIEPQTGVRKGRSLLG